jgi:malonyl-CoA decarboxylase
MLGRATFLNDLLHQVADQGRGLVARAFGHSIAEAVREQRLDDLLAALLSGRGEASGVAIAQEIMRRYEQLDPAGRLAFLRTLESRFAPNPEAVRDAFRRFEAEPTSAALRALNEAVEPPRQEVIRRLNQAPGNTARLVRLREDLLDAIPENPELADVDADFQHLFGSWFNRGFLVMRRIDWTTPAHILEKIIRYEAVHAIESWDDLRRRLEPPDRRCFGFFHPALADEPLIFVEVALTTAIPDAIQPILAAGRKPIAAEAATTAVFYSISNCQRGLARISFGNFLIKQVAEELKRECPGLHTFVTLSPVPGLRRWLDGALGSLPLEPAEREALASLGDAPDEERLRAAAPALRKAAGLYLLGAKTAGGQPRDPVQRFHLGNGARLERLNLHADVSPKGIAESFGVMVNYLYALDEVEANHERYAQAGEVVAAQGLSREFSSLMGRLAPDHGHQRRLAVQG